jgi:hypothetical protein
MVEVDLSEVESVDVVVVTPPKLHHGKSDEALKHK